MDVKKKIEELEKAAAEKSRVPVIMAELQLDGRWLFNGKTYTREELDELQRKNNCPMILDSVCAIVEREELERAKGEKSDGE